MLSLFRSSRIVRKLTIRVLIAESVCFIIIILLSVIFLLPQLTSRAVDIAKDVCLQMEKEIGDSLTAMETASQYIASSKELKEVLIGYYYDPSEINYESVRLVLYQLKLSRPEIRGLVLESSDQTRFDSIDSLSEYDFSILSQQWYRWAWASDNGSGFSRIYEPTGYSEVFGQPADVKVRSFAYSKSYYINAGVYVLTLFCSAENMLSNAASIAQNTFSGYGLMDQAGEPFFHSGAIEMQNDGLNKAVAVQGGMTVTKRGGYFIVPVPSGMWHLIAYADDWMINRTFFTYFIATVVLFAVLSVLTVFLIVPLIHRTIQPLGRLAETMGRVKDGNCVESFSSIKTGDEIEALSDVFNDMIQSLQKNTEERIMHEQREQKMKFSLLASQIDPHFICNTMNTINYMAREERYKEIVAINTALISLLQDRLRVDSVRVFDTVAQEVKTVKAYLIIQGYRYENNVRIVWNIDDEVLDQLIPKNIIQPLVENALFHGLIDEETGETRGNIIIDIQKKNAGVIIRVQDDGKGIDAETLRHINAGGADQGWERGKHIGLRNIRERLTYLYKDEDCLKIESNGGTTVSMFISK